MHHHFESLRFRSRSANPRITAIACCTLVLLACNEVRLEHDAAVPLADLGATKFRHIVGTPARELPPTRFPQPICTIYKEPPTGVVWADAGTFAKDVLPYGYPGSPEVGIGIFVDLPDHSAYRMVYPPGLAAPGRPIQSSVTRSAMDGVVQYCWDPFNGIEYAVAKRVDGSYHVPGDEHGLGIAGSEPISLHVITPSITPTYHVIAYRQGAAVRVAQFDYIHWRLVSSLELAADALAGSEVRAVESDGQVHVLHIDQAGRLVLQRDVFGARISSMLGDRPVGEFEPIRNGAGRLFVFAADRTTGQLMRLYADGPADRFEDVTNDPVRYIRPFSAPDGHPVLFFQFYKPNLATGDVFPQHLVYQIREAQSPNGQIFWWAPWPVISRQRYRMDQDWASQYDLATLDATAYRPFMTGDRLGIAFVAASDPGNQKINWIVEQDDPVPNEGNVDGYWKFWSTYSRYAEDEHWESIPSQEYVNARRFCTMAQCANGGSSCDRQWCPPQPCSAAECAAGTTSCDRANCPELPESCATPAELELCTFYVPCFEVVAAQYNADTPCALWDRAQDKFLGVLQPRTAVQINAEREQFHQYECYSQRSIEAKFGPGVALDSEYVPNWRGSGLLADAYIPYESAFYSRGKCSDTVISREIFF